MTLTMCLLLMTQVFLVATEPIDEGLDAGAIKVRKGQKVVINSGKFAYLAHLDFLTFQPRENSKKLIPVHGYCGGTLVKNDVILTAAHCIEYPESKQKITAWLGVVDTQFEKGMGQEIPVRGFTIHGAYIKSNDDLNNINDIALLWLQRPAEIDGKLVKLAKLPAADFDAVNKQGWIVGWGTGSCGKHNSMLQKARMKGVSSAECQEYYETTKIPFTFICVLSPNKRATSTHGDSGGPFVINDTVLGISSFGAVDMAKSDFKEGKIVCDAKKPSVYTYVPIYLKWIERSSREGPETLIIRPQVTPQRRLLSPQRRYSN